MSHPGDHDFENIIYKLAKISRKARVLFSGAVFSKATWGKQTSGLSYKEWTQIEVAAANAAGFKAGRCRYSDLCIAYGPNGNPFVRDIRELFVLWFKIIIPLVNNQHPLLEKFDIAWPLIYNDLSEGSNRITLEKFLNRVDGIAAHVMVILYGVGWIPISYNT